MAKETKDGSKKLVSRRDFLMAGGAVIAAGALSACTPKTETVTSTATKTVTSSVTGAATTVTTTAPGTTKTVTATASVVPTTSKLVVFDPRGTPPAITVTPQAKRLDTIDGKTIYVVDIMFPYTQTFVKTLTKVLQQKYSKTTWVYLEKGGASYSSDAPETWEIVRAKGQGMVIAVGH
jgi:ABC-type oligopeptide transport system substrate-binding subunit